MNKIFLIILFCAYGKGVTSIVSLQPLLLTNKDISEIFGPSGCIEGTVMATEISAPIQKNKIRKPVHNRLIDLKNVVIHQNTTKNKTPMCLVNEMARYNNIHHHYALIGDDGVPHKKIFTVQLNFGNETYTGQGSSIKNAQHDAASLAVRNTAYKHPPPKLANARKISLTPTVELNAVTMKLGLQPIYKILQQPTFENYYPVLPVDSYSTYTTAGNLYYQQTNYEYYSQNYLTTYRNGMPISPANNCTYQCTRPYKILLTLGEKNYVGTGATEQKARHSAAFKALDDIKNNNISRPYSEISNEPNNVPDTKSPISLVYEKAAKLKFEISFTDIAQHGPSHVRVYETECIVGQYRTIGSGNSKKSSKQNAAERMYEIIRSIPSPPSSLNSKKIFKRRGGPKIVRRINEPNPIPNIPNGDDEPDPIAQLEKEVRNLNLDAQLPRYFFQQETNGSSSKDYYFRVEVKVGENQYTATGVSKKEAKKAAAVGMLQQLGMESSIPDRQIKKSDVKVSNEHEIVKPVSPKMISGRQLAPGLLLVPHAELLKTDNNDQYFFENQNKMENEIDSKNENKESSEFFYIDAEHHLKRVSEVLRFEFQFMDFPKGIHSEFLSVLQMSFEIPQTCSGSGNSLSNSHNVAATYGLRHLERIGKIKIDKVQMENPAEPNSQGIPITVSILQQ